MGGPVLFPAMVVFVNGKPSKKDYCKYKNQDRSRARRLCQYERSHSQALWSSTADGLTPPDLIVIDGDKGQVNIANVIQDELVGYPNCRSAKE